LDLYNASSLKQLSPSKHVAPLGHIIIISRQSILALNPWCCIHVLSGEAANTNFIVFCLNRSCLEPTIYPSLRNFEEMHHQDKHQLLCWIYIYIHTWSVVTSLSTFCLYIVVITGIFIISECVRTERFVTQNGRNIRVQKNWNKRCSKFSNLYLILLSWFLDNKICLNWCSKL
jgi:hypothetical protein